MTRDLMSRWRANIDDARQLARETTKNGRRVRVTTERAGGRWRTALIAVTAGAAGAVSMYLLDPLLGRRRRTMVADRSVAALRDATERADKARRLAGGRLGGVVQETFHVSEEPMPNDAALAAKVETELFRDPSVPKGKININVESGRVVLRGEVDSARQRSALARKAKGIGGVTDVENLLHLPGEPIVTSTPRDAVQATTTETPAPNLPD